MSHFCFTLNNYKEEHIYKLRKIFNEHKCRYIRWNYEVAPTTGTPHLQGYIQFSKRTKDSTVRNLITGAHITKCNGSSEDNINYTSKPETRTDREPEELGEAVIMEAKQAGTRTDLAKIKARLLKGDSINNVVREDITNLQQLQFAEKFVKYCNEATLRPNLRVSYYWGESGVGKTRTAYKVLAKKGKVYKYSGDGNFWNAYQGEEYIIIDDIDADMFKKKELLRILDIYPTYVNIKNGHMPLNAKHIIITADDEIDKVFGAYSSKDLSQLKRRVKYYKKFEQA